MSNVATSPNVMVWGLKQIMWVPSIRGSSIWSELKVNFYSRFDGALSVSNIEKAPREVAHAVGDAASKLTFGLLDFLERNPDQKWEKRLGESPAPENAPPGFVSVNATELANRKIDHSDHIDSTQIVARIAKELEI